MPTSPAQRSVVLGLFIVVQLVFLPAQNFLEPLQKKREDIPVRINSVIEQAAPGWQKAGHLANFVEEGERLAQRWSQVTWQLQSWTLFAPDIGRECVFPALFLANDDPAEAPGGMIHFRESPGAFEIQGRVLRSDNEPADMTRYFRWGNFRLRRFENNLVAYLSPLEAETEGEILERFRQRIKEHVAYYHAMLTGYVRFRCQQLELPRPRQVILVMRRYHLKGPAGAVDFFEGPFNVPVARWRWHGNGILTNLETFNPVTLGFEPFAS